MSKVQTLRGFISQRLSAAAEEIFELFERTIAEYEEQLCRSKEENERQQKLLDAGFSSEVRLHRADIQQLDAVSNREVRLHRAVYQQLLVNEEEVHPEQQGGSHSLDQGDPPELTHIKEEELEEPEEAEIIQFTLSPVPMKSEDDEGERTQPPEADGESEPDGDFNPDVQCESEGFICDRGETSEPQSGLNPASEKACKTSFVPVEHHQIQDQIQTEKKDYPCSLCGKKFPKEKSLKTHMKRHSEEKCFSCSVCKRTFPWRGELMIHMRTHTREKPFSCSVCEASFAHSSSLAVHLKSHSGEKPFSCSVCGKRFARKKHQTQHMRTHTGEKPFSCLVCGKRFAEKANLARHLTVHTGEKMFCCSVCGKRFAHSITLKRHSLVHTGEKPFSCEICDKRFTRLEHIKKHKCVVGESSTNG